MFDNTEDAMNKLWNAIFDACYINNKNPNEAWDTFIEEKEKWKIPVYLVGAQSAEEGYETMQAYQRCGIHVLPNQAPIAAYCWLWLQLSAVNATEQTMNKTEGQDI